jgi:hypothetical protein
MEGGGFFGLLRLPLVQGTEDNSFFSVGAACWLLSGKPLKPYFPAVGDGFYGFAWFLPTTDMLPGRKRDEVPFHPANPARGGGSTKTRGGLNPSESSPRHRTCATVVWRQPTSGHFFGYFLFGLEKKVTRLPAGTGEVVFCFTDQP